MNRLEITSSIVVSSFCTSFHATSAPPASAMMSITLYAMSPRDLFTCWLMLREWLPNTPRILVSTAGTFRFTTPMRTVFSASLESSSVSGKFTELMISPVVKKRMTVSAAMEAAASSASSVDAPKWGITMAFLWSQTSSSGKSVTYLPLTEGLFIHALRSFESTSSPRAKFSKTASDFMYSNISALMIPLVPPSLTGLLMKGTLRET
mmetsp:Transcript_45448/g.84429  ORF Transcript_45448/g.84429 Transcript_45448/m.84429 type:complete len:207 (+) Transcript_45448:320-940(+)